jgi:hypothetical protein
MSQNSRLGLKTSRSPGSITNMQHHDQSGSEKSFNGTAGTIRKIVAVSTTLEPLENFALLRVCNTAGALGYVWIGPADQVPGTVDATTGFALPANSVENFFVGQSSDPKISMAVKTSAASVQVAVLDH